MSKECPCFLGVLILCSNGEELCEEEALPSQTINGSASSGIPKDGFCLCHGNRQEQLGREKCS